MIPTSFTTDRLFLRTIEPEDALEIYESYAQDLEVTKFLVWKPHQSLKETDAYISRCLLAKKENSSTTYTLVQRENNQIIGALDLREVDKHRIDFGYVLSRPSWGQGLMTEALSHIIKWVFSQSRIFRFGAVCDVENIASSRVMEKCGLVREGTLRRWLVHPNVSLEPRDCFSYSIVRDN